MYVLVFLLIFSTANVYSMFLGYDALVAVEKLIFPTSVTITYNNDVPKEDRLYLNERKQNFLCEKMLLWKEVAKDYKHMLPDLMYQMISHIPSIDILIRDSQVVHCKEIVEQSYSFSPNYMRHFCYEGLVTEEIFRQKLLYLEMLLYFNTEKSSAVPYKQFMIARFNDEHTSDTVERNRILDFLCRHKYCGIDKAKILATIFLLYLP